MRDFPDSDYFDDEILEEVELADIGQIGSCMVCGDWKHRVGHIISRNDDFRYQVKYFRHLPRTLDAEFFLTRQIEWMEARGLKPPGTQTNQLDNALRRKSKAVYVPNATCLCCTQCVSLAPLGLPKISGLWHHTLLRWIVLLITN